jgi:hypothetical protein
MESCGLKDRIQLSQETADLLIAAGKTHWLVPREDKIEAKGKGELNTYWLDMKTSQSATSTSSRSSDSRGTSSIGGGTSSLGANDIICDFNEQRTTFQKRAILSGKIERLIEWNSEVLGRMLQHIIARRELTYENSKPIDWTRVKKKPETSPFDEVKEIISLPELVVKAGRQQTAAEDIELSFEVSAQLRDYVAHVAMMYVLKEHFLQVLNVDTRANSCQFCLLSGTMKILSIILNM